MRAVEQLCPHRRKEMKNYAHVEGKMNSYALVEEKKLTIMLTWKKGNEQLCPHRRTEMKNYAHVEEKR